jgi:tetratricopeptide (TPR) repeat protein
MTKPALRGPLSPWTLPGLLHELRAKRLSGLLTFEEGEAKRALRFRDGQIVAAFTNVDGEKLKERLLALGLVGEADLEQALAVMRREAKSLLDVLADRSLVGQAELVRAVAEQVRDILARAFTTTQGAYHFQAQAPGTAEDPGLRIPTESLILEAVRRIENPAVVRYALGEIDRTLVLAAGLALERLNLTTADGYFLSRVDGALSGRQVIELLPTDADEAHRTLLSLLCAGIVAFEGPPKAASRLPEMAMRADERAIELGLAPPPPPPAPPPASPSAPSQAAAPVAPAAVSRPTATMEMEDEVAEESLAKARRELDEGRPGEAARILETVLDLAQGGLRQKVRKLLAVALLSDPRSEKRGESQLQIQVSEFPDDVEAFFMLGNVYKRRGLRSRAEAMYKRVLEIDPAHAGARAAALPLKPVAAPRPHAAGLFGRLRGRD